MIGSTTHDSLIPVLCLPLAPFSLSTSSLGLLLAFRANTAYQHWDEARKNWGMNINHTRDLVRLGNAYYDHSAVSPAHMFLQKTIVTFRIATQTVIQIVVQMYPQQYWPRVHI